MSNERRQQELLSELRTLEGVELVIVWRSSDAESLGIDPTTVNWKTVEDISIEHGWDIISNSDDL